VQTLNRRTSHGAGRITDAMTGAAWRAATEVGAAAIICISDTGFTVRSIARFRPSMPILGFSPNPHTVNQLTVSWGTTPLAGPSGVDSIDTMSDLVCIARDQGYVRRGDTVAVLAGVRSKHDVGGRATDLLRLVDVP
jgi:pyruvate kinase